MNSVRTFVYNGVAGAEAGLPRIVYLRARRSWGFVRAHSEAPPQNEVARMITAPRTLPSDHGMKNTEIVG